ncbi:hypothetical protein FDJ70_05825 [Clostridium botulinum]|nr:hypothetical protein [Clostridium botulinum]
MALSYKQQLVFTDDRKKSVTVSIGDIVEIKGHEYISHKDVEIRGRIEDFDLGRWKEIIIVNEITNEEYHFHLDQIEEVELVIFK